MSDYIPIPDADDLTSDPTQRLWYHEQLTAGLGDDVFVIMKNPSWPEAGNPSLAEARRMAIDCRFSNLYVGNLFGRRAPKPRQLNSCESYEDAVVDANDGYLELMASETALVVAAWGAPNGIRTDWYRRRVAEVIDLIGADRLTSFGTTDRGHPRHCYSWRIEQYPLQDWSATDVNW